MSKEWIINDLKRVLQDIDDAFEIPLVDVERLRKRIQEALTMVKGEGY